MSFTPKKINLTFKLGRDTNGVQYKFTEGDYDQVSVTGLRIQATIANAGPPSMGEASVIVHGLTLSLMNQLSTVRRLNKGQVTLRFYEMVIEAGDDIAGMSTVFQGQVSMAAVDMNGAPDASLHIIAHAGLLEAVKPTACLSFPGVADVATIMQGLAVQNGYTFENNGVTAKLSTPYFPGSPKQQMEECADAADINWILDNGTLAIWPKGGSRGGAIPLISAATGMIGYPSNYDVGIAVRTLFNPQIGFGKKFQVQSGLLFANGTFVTFGITHELESETPNGKWESSFIGSSFNV